MAKSEQEILEELEKKYHSNLFDKNNRLDWNGIEGTMKSWLEIGDTYLEKCSGYGSGAIDILCINNSLDDIIKKYGEDNWEIMAAENGEIVRFSPYHRVSSLDSYVCDKYNFKSRAQIQEILNSSVDELDLNSISINAADALKDNGMRTVGDIVKLEPNELFIKMQDTFGPLLHNDATAITIGAIMKAGLVWDNGKTIYNKWKEDGKSQYRNKLAESLLDNFIEPNEWDSLNEIAEKYGLSKEFAQDAIEFGVAERIDDGYVRPTVAHPITPENAFLFSTFFNTHKYEVEKRAVEGLQNEPVHYFNNMSVELGKEILETLSIDGGYTLYGDLNKNKLWLRDEQTGETEETNLNHILSKVQMITESWKRDETTVNENKFIEQLNSLETDDILVPVDVHYKFNIPDEIIIDSDEAERKLKNRIYRAIKNVFHIHSETIRAIVSVANEKREADYVVRHNIVCSKKTDYSNFRFDETNAQLQYAVGMSLNNEFDLDHKILFSELKSFVPERYLLGIRVVNVNKETIEKFAKTPEEYASEATEEILIKFQATREHLKEIFKDQKKAFDKVLSENPLLKKYVEEQWKSLKKNSKDYIHSEEFVSKFGDWEKANRLEKLKNAEPLVHNNDIIMNNENVSQKVEELRKNNDVASLRKVGEQIGKFVFQDLRKQQNLLGEKDKVLIHNNDRNLEVIFPMSGIRETKEHNATTKGHIEAIAYIPEIIKNGIYIASEKNEDNRRPHIEHFEYFAMGIKLHDEDFTCKSVFGVTKSGDVYYDQSLSEIEKGRLIDIMLEKNKVLQRVPSNRKGEAGLDSFKAFNLVNTKDSFELSENKSPSAYYDKRLINICQVPQMPYLEMVNGKWQPKKEAVQAVKDGKLYVEKIGQNYTMHDEKSPSIKRNDDYIHSEEFISKFGDWEKANRLEKLKNAETLVSDGKIIISGDDFSEEVEEARNKGDLKVLKLLARNIGYEQKGFYINTDQNEKIQLSMRNTSEIYSHHLSQKGHIEAIVKIGDIIKNAIWIEDIKNEDTQRNSRIEKYSYFASGLKIEGTDYTVKSVISTDKDGNHYYDQRLSEIEKGKLIEILTQRMSRENPIESLSKLYDKRLINICQVPQMPYLEMVNGKWQPKKEAVQAVKDGKLYVEKIGQNYQMRDSLNLAEKLAPEKQHLSLDSFMQDVEAQCGNDKSVKNILIQSANLIKNLDESSKKLLREEFSKAEIKGQDSLVDFLDKKINPKKEMKRKVSKNRDSDFERTR